MKVLYIFFLIIFNTSLKATECGNKLEKNNQRSILYINLNGSIKELNTIEREACQTGKNLYVIPDNSIEFSKNFEESRIIEEKIDSIDCELENNKCTSLNYRYEQLVINYERQLPLIEEVSWESLHKSLKKFKEKKVFFDTIIISGHSGGGYFDGILGAFDQQDLAIALKELQLDKALKNLILLACYSATPSEIEKYKKNFKNLEYIFGFTGLAPASFRPHNLNFLSESLNLLNKHQNFGQTLLEWENIYSLWFYDSVILYAIWNKDDVYSYNYRRNFSSKTSPFNKNNICLNPTNENRIRNIQNEFQRYFVGNLPIPNDKYSGELRKIYEDIRFFDYCTTDNAGKAFNLPKAMEAFKLVFFNNVKENFVKYYRFKNNLISKTSEIIDNENISPELKNLFLKLVNTTSSFNRKDTIALSNEFSKQAKKHPKLQVFKNLFDEKIKHLSCVPFSWTDKHEPLQIETPHCDEDD